MEFPSGWLILWAARLCLCGLKSNFWLLNKALIVLHVSALLVFSQTLCLIFNSAREWVSTKIQFCLFLHIPCWIRLLIFLFSKLNNIFSITCKKREQFLKATILLRCIWESTHSVVQVQFWICFVLLSCNFGAFLLLFLVRFLVLF